jgi:hypothetical protein
MIERQKFEEFMFSEKGCELHSKMNCSDISANAFAYEVWLACSAQKEAELKQKDELIAELSKSRNEVIEKCAKICDENAKLWEEQISRDVNCGKADAGALVCASQIRAFIVN